MEVISFSMTPAFMGFLQFIRIIPQLSYIPQNPSFSFTSRITFHNLSFSFLIMFLSFGLATPMIVVVLLTATVYGLCVGIMESVLSSKSHSIFIFVQ